MRLTNNYSNGYNPNNRINEIRGLSNDYGLNLNNTKEQYNEENIIKPKCNHRKSNIKNK